MAGVGRSVAHDGYGAIVFGADGDFTPTSLMRLCTKDSLLPRGAGDKRIRPMLRLRELTAQVSATHASTKRFVSVSRG